MQKWKDYKKIEEYLLNNESFTHFDEALEQIYTLREEIELGSKFPVYPNYFERNVVVIILENERDVYIKGELIDYIGIFEYSLDHLMNEQDDENMSEKEIIFCKNISRELRISKCHFYIVISDKIDSSIISKITKLVKDAIEQYKAYIVNNMLEADVIQDDKDCIELINSNLKNRVEFYNLDNWKRHCYDPFLNSN